MIDPWFIQPHPQTSVNYLRILCCAFSYWNNRLSAMRRAHAMNDVVSYHCAVRGRRLVSHYRLGPCEFRSRQHVANHRSLDCAQICRNSSHWWISVTGTSISEQSSGWNSFLCQNSSGHSSVCLLTTGCTDELSSESWAWWKNKWECTRIASWMNFKCSSHIFHTFSPSI